MYSLVRSGTGFQIVDGAAGCFPDAPVDPIPYLGSAVGLWETCSAAEREAWSRFTASGSIDPRAVRRPIRESWIRCRQAELDFAGGKSWDFMSDRELAARRDNILDVVKPITETLYQCVRGSDFLVHYIDGDGYILFTVGDAGALRQAEKIHFGPGTNWSETSVGTNGPGTALALREPIQVTGAEHYREDHHLWTCAAAPVRDPAGNIVGCLDASGPRSNAHPYLLSMVVSGARAIQNAFALEQSHTDMLRRHQHLNAIFDSVPDGIIALDNRGVIQHINAAAARIVQWHPEKIAGKKLGDLFRYENAIQRFVTSGIPGGEQEIQVQTRGGKMFCSVASRPVRHHDGSAAGTIISLREVPKQPAGTKRASSLSAKFTFEDIIGESPALKTVVLKAKIVSRSPSTILLLGESGTGKEIFAQAIHNASGRNRGPFVAVNCGAIPKDLIQSELFGYVEGAFTGAKRGGRPGKLELANGGTIFLDEIADMPLEMQTNLLRVLEERTIVRVGGNKVLPIDVRVIAATHKDLKKEVAKGKFRDDLYYRLNVIVIKIPSLRERTRDVPLLVRHYVKELAQKLGKCVVVVEPDVFSFFSAYPWPGNVRELVNVLEQALNLVQGEELLIQHLPASLKGRESSSSRGLQAANPAGVQPLSVVEKAAIERALAHYNGNITKVANALGIGRNTLYDKMKKYGIRKR